MASHHHRLQPGEDSLLVKSWMEQMDGTSGLSETLKPIKPVMGVGVGRFSQNWLVVWSLSFWNFIIPTDQYFFTGVETTNQKM